jgi:uncharacterized protein YjbI with pentapeptide repeats
MKDAKSIKSNFEIVDRQEYINCIKIEKKKYSIGRGALDASLYFDRLTKENLMVNLGKDNVDDNSRNRYLTLKNINSILCLFFHKDSKIDHEINHVRRFLKNLKYHNKKMEDKIAFDNFIKLIRPHLNHNFSQYNYTLNPTTWRFEITNIDSLPKENIDINSSKNQDELELKKLEIEKFFQLKKEQVILNNKRKKVVISFFFIIGIVIVGLYINSTIQKKTAQEQKILQERNIIENAKEKSSSRTVLLSDIYSTINKELKEDYNNDGIKNLSEELIGRIISLSGSLTPYEYKRDSTIVKYSPERAGLFNSLIRYKLSIKSYQSIFNEADFSFSDFSGLDFSKLDLIRLVNGFQGSAFNDVQLLVSVAKRPNFKNSSFKKTNLNDSKLFGDFSGSNFIGAKLDNVIFNWTKASGVDFGRNNFTIKIFNSDFSNSNFKGSTLYCTIENSDLRGANFNYCTFYDYSKSYDKNASKTSNSYSPFNNTFSNVFLSPDDLFYEFKFDVHEANKEHEEYVITSLENNSKIKKKPKTEIEYLARSFLISNHYEKNRKYYFAQVPIDLLKLPNGKEKAILGKHFSLIGRNFDINNFIEEWKKGTDKFHTYIIRSNDLYYDAPFIIDDSRKILYSKGEITVVKDTLYINSGKTFHDFNSSKNNDNFKQCCNPRLIKSEKKATSFKNAEFNGITFKTKISNVSFEGSTFTNSYFYDSELYNVDFKKVKGFIFLKGQFKFDSLKVDKNFAWFSIPKIKDSILNIKHNFPQNNYTLRDHLSALEKAPKKQSLYDYPLGYSSVELSTLYTRFNIIENISKRILFHDISSSKEIIIRDKNYINLLEKYCDSLLCDD